MSNLRAVLPLGKYHVTEVGYDSFKIALGGSTTMEVKFPLGQRKRYDVKPGDLLTFYTEVLMNTKGT